ncbi:zf-C3HC-domain-containing protein [Pholiota molesta]|nr:zf-C3HC-domain-containing protein [Pholiota molesta]
MTDASAVPEVPSANESKIRSTKRKLEDAFQVLDNAVTTTTPSERPSPPKRANTIRSLYSTLAKYGIRSGPRLRSAQPAKVSHTNNTPHLSAILARAASKTKHTFSFKFPSPAQTPAPPLPATAEYRPSSLPSFLARLATYKLTTYANKPPPIDAVAASKCGWINDGKDRLVCGLCNASWVVAGREGMTAMLRLLFVANALVEKQRASLVEAHKDGCPWKTRQCEDSIYCIPLQSPTAMIKDIRSRALTMDPVIKDIQIKHPLTSSQINSLREIFSSFTPQPTLDTSSDSRMDEDHPSTPPPPPSEPSETAILAALFGWSLVPPAAPEPLRRASTTRAPSRAPSVPASPALSRASSVHGLHLRLPSVLTQLKPENVLLQCELCQRRLGLWAFSARSPADESTDTLDSIHTAPKKALPRRTFDLLKEHRSYCPYVVRSTVVPSLPVPPTASAPAKSGASANGHTRAASNLSLAVLIVVLRYGMAQKQRIEYSFLATRKETAADANEAGDEMEVDSVKAMVAGVKTRGGKDLLRYVRGLLG